MKIYKYEKRKILFNHKANIRLNIFSLIIFCSFFQLIYSHRKINFHSSNISIKVNTTGIVYYYHLNGYHLNCEGIIYNAPNKVYINGIDKGSPQHSIFINDTNTVIKIFWYNNVKNTICLFAGCENIKEIDLSEFDSSGVTAMNNMFSGCSALTSIKNLSNLNTGNVEIMEYMFAKCFLLTSLDLSNFNTKKVTSIAGMFQKCYSLTFINLSSFETPKLQKISFLFNECKSLTSFYFPNIGLIYNVQMESVFDGCKSLKSLDLSNFTFFKGCSFFNKIFKDCSSLEYINFGNISPGCQYYSNAFQGTNEGLIICGTDNKWATVINKDNPNKVVNISINCNNNLDNNNNNNKCYAKNYTVLLNKDICTKCGNNYYHNNNESSFNYEKNIICQKVPDGYYLDLIEEYPKPKQCFSSCKTCEKGGNEEYHNCFECKEDYRIFEQNYSNYKNCYNHTIINVETEIKTQFETNLNDETEIKTQFETNINYETKEEKKTDISFLTISINKDNLNKLNELNDLIFQYNKTFIDSGNDVEMKKGPIVLIYTNTVNQREKEHNKNNISLNLLQCEDRLKISNNISLNSSLYLLIYEFDIDGMKIPKIEYEVYYPKNNETFIKLDLIVCKGLNVELSYPAKINDLLDKYNGSSDYYNNLCYKTTSNFGTDISLKDRKDNFINDNMTLCEEDCSLIDYNYTTEKAKCSCLIKITLPFFDEIKFDKNKLYKSFIDVKNIANINLMKCYKDVFKFNNLIKNYGFYYFVFLFILYFVTLILFYTKFYTELFNKIAEIENAKKYDFKPDKDKKIKKNKN